MAGQGEVVLIGIEVAMGRVTSVDGGVSVVTVIGCGDGFGHMMR